MASTTKKAACPFCSALEKYELEKSEWHDKALALANKEALEEVEEIIDSGSDERIVNNVMRHEYRVLDDSEKASMKSIKDIGLEFHDLCDQIGQSRELSLAKTKIEEAVMWAVKHITK